MEPRLSATVVTRLLRAVADAADLDPSLAGRRASFLQELGDAIGADAGYWAWGRGWPDSGVLTPIARIDYGFTDEHRGRFAAFSLDEATVNDFQKRVQARMGDRRRITTLRDVYTAAEWAAVPPMRAMIVANGWGSWVHGVRYSAADTWSNLFFVRSDAKPEFGPADADAADLALEGVPWFHSTAEESIPAEAFAGLTERQRTVLILLLDGTPRKRIASHLRITEDTVGDHIKAIYNHFGVSSSIELAAIFLRNR